MHCYTTVHDMAGKNNPLQWFSSFQESVLLYSLNTRSYENHHNSFNSKTYFRFFCLAHDADLID